MAFISEIDVLLGVLAGVPDFCFNHKAVNYWNIYILPVVNKSIQIYHKIILTSLNGNEA